MQGKFTHVISLLIISFVLSACGSDSGGGVTPNDGGNNSVTSHRAGENCMSSNCHVQGGTGVGVFTASGTVYKSNGSVQPSATVVLYIHNTNTIVASLDTDDSGNFYTTQTIDELFTGNEFVTGVDVEVRGPGSTRTMPGVVTEGACSSCHGDSQGRVVAN